MNNYFIQDGLYVFVCKHVTYKALLHVSTVFIQVT